jgi:hypothetical protein
MSQVSSADTTAAQILAQEIAMNSTPFESVNRFAGKSQDREN